MANAVVAHQRFGPETYQVSASATGASSITGGKLVMFDAATGTVKLTSGPVANWLGVALYDAQPADTGVGADTAGAYVANLSTYQTEVAVAYTGVFALTNGDAGAIAQGTVVYSLAGGLISATVAGRAVGIVTNPGGIGIGASGFVRLFN